MSFIWPAMLILLVLVPLLLGLYAYLQQRRKRIAAVFGSLGFVQSGPGQSPGMRRHIPPAMFLVGLTILILALARPETVVQVPRVEGTVILMFDVSGSMAADDLKPTRMEAAKDAARNFVANQPETVTIGVVAFSESGFSIQVPTNEQQSILGAINRLEPQRGTSLAHGIIAAINAIAASRGEALLNLPGDVRDDDRFSMPTAVPHEVYESAAIVLLSDGENTVNADPFEAAEIARDLGIPIHTIGIGSPAGTILEVNGFMVHTRLDEAMLQQISALTGGTYHNAQNEQDLQAVYNSLGRELVIRPEKMEVTSIFAGTSILILLIGGVFSLLWFSRLP